MRTGENSRWLAADPLPGGPKGYRDWGVSWGPCGTAVLGLHCTAWAEICLLFIVRCLPHNSCPLFYL